MEGEISNQDIRRHIVGACIQWARNRGYCDSAGVLRGLVTLSKEPTSLDELALETGYSKSTVSVNMRLLENLGLVKRSVIPGDKRHLYVPIFDLDMIRNNKLDSISKENQIFCDALDRTERDLKAIGTKAGYLLERVSDLRKFYEREKKVIDKLKKNHLEMIQKLPDYRCHDPR